MATYDVELSSLGSSGTATGSQEGTISRSYRASYIVTVSSDVRSPAGVFRYFELNADLPWPGRSYRYSDGFDGFSFCKSIDIDWVDKSDGKFIARATFEAAQQQEEEKPDNEGKNTTNPLLWADELDVSFSQISVPVEFCQFLGFVPQGIENRFLRNFTIQPVVNSALKPFDPTLEEEMQIKIIRITKYTGFYEGEAFNRYIGAQNADRVVINKPLYGFRDSIEPAHALIKGLSAQFGITNGIRHWRTTIEVHVSPFIFGWNRVVVDRGLDARRGQGDPNGAGGTVSASDLAAYGTVGHEPIKDKDGVPVSEPVLLDGNGQPLKPGETPVLLVYRTRPELLFSVIRW